MRADFFWSDTPDLDWVHGQHDLWLVLLSLVVSCVASGQALRLAAFARLAQTKLLRRWAVASGALALGTGIWAMHFIGMLSHPLHAAAQYDLKLTLLSILPGIAASAVALTLLANHKLPTRQLVLGGVIVGIGIAAMHYSGMAAVHMQVPHKYSPLWFALSLLIGVALAMLALWVRFGISRADSSLGAPRKVLAAVIMGSAIAAMHYVAMLALRVPASTAPVTNTLPNNSSLLGLTIALVTLATGSLIAQTHGLIHYRTRWQKADMNEARLRALVDMAADGIICINPQGVVTDYNPAAQAIFGWSAQEVLGQNIKMLMPSALSSHHDHYLSRHEQSQRENALPLQNKISEVLGQHKDGALIPLRLALSQAEALGQRMYVGLLTDLSERKKTERQLHIAATVFEHCFEGVVVLDANRKIVDINPAFMRISGLKRQTARNRDFAGLFSFEDADAHIATVWTEIGREGHWQGVWAMRHDGRQHQISLTAVRDEQQRLHHYIGICYQTSEHPLTLPA